MSLLKPLFLATLGALSLTLSLSIWATEKSVVVAYQQDSQPGEAGFVDGQYEKVTGYKIDYRVFNSGAEVFAAMASGDVQVGYVGSSPYAASVSSGLKVKAFYITTGGGTDEALVVRNGSGINTLADLKGKKLAAAPVSTDHYQLLQVLKMQGLSEKDTQVFAIPAADIVAAYQRGDIDGAFIWNPALEQLKKNGKVLITSDEVGKKGAPTFGAWVASEDFVRDNPEFLKQFVAINNQYVTSYLAKDPSWEVNGANILSLTKLHGGTPADHVSSLKNMGFVTLQDQLSDKWLGGGDQSGVALILKDTSQFLKEQKKISRVLPAYGEFVTADEIKSLNP